MNYDVEYLIHQLYEARRCGIAEEMEEAIEDLLLALKSEEVVLVYAQTEDNEYTADGLSMRDEAAYEDFDDLSLDSEIELGYEQIASITEIGED